MRLLEVVMTSTRISRLAAIAGGVLLLAGCAGGGGSAPVASNAAGASHPAVARNEVQQVSAALGNRLDQMMAQQVALTTH